MEWITGLLDGVERDCRLALLQGELPFSEGVIAFSVLLKAQKSLSPSLLKNTTFILPEMGIGVLMCQCCMEGGGRLNLPLGPSQFLVLSAIPGGPCWALVAVGQFHCMGAGQAAFTIGCMLLARKYSRTCSCQLVYGDGKAKAC